MCICIYRYIHTYLKKIFIYITFDLIIAQSLVLQQMKVREL